MKNRLPEILCLLIVSLCIVVLLFRFPQRGYLINIIHIFGKLCQKYCSYDKLLKKVSNFGLLRRLYI